MTAIMIAKPYVGALLLNYLGHLGLRADPDDAFSVCAPLVPTLSKGPEMVQTQRVPNAQGSYRRSLSVPFEQEEAIMAEGIACIRDKMT